MLFTITNALQYKIASITKMIRVPNFSPLYSFDVITCVEVEDSEEELCGNVFTRIPDLLTGVGASGRMHQPQVRFVNTSHFRLSWPESFHVGGPIARYEYRIASQVRKAKHCH